LLRVLEDGSLRRIGSLKERRVDVRLLAATNRDMDKDVAEGRFREDLYYRINVMSLKLPPLRERKGDIPLLVRHLLGDDWTITPAAISALEAYSWPGNVRQLANTIERAQIMSDDKCIGLEALPHEVLGGAVPKRQPETPTGNGTFLADIEKAHILEVLTRERGNKARTARALGVNRRSLYRLLEKYDIHLSETAGEPASPSPTGP
jgi:transcriptional regulator with PAS, ATPase and Fis domain